MEAPRLRFWHWYSFNLGDYGEVQVRVVGEAWPEEEGIPRFTSTSGGWTSPLVDLSEYVGQQVEIGFLFHSTDVPGGGPDVSTGWYVDDLSIVSGSMVRM